VHTLLHRISGGGLHHTSELTRTHIYRRVSQEAVRRYDQIFPCLRAGSLLVQEPLEAWRLALVVGMLLKLVNHSDAFFGEKSLPWGGILMNFRIPFLVSVYSGACASDNNE
jgi:hypothetical protein